MGFTTWRPREGTIFSFWGKDVPQEKCLNWSESKEAEVRHNGGRLGAVGGRIVAEVLLGLIDADPGSYRNAAEEWQPELPAAREGDFTVADLLRFAKIA